MAQERIEKKPGCWSRLKTAFRSKRAKQSELTPSLPTNVNDSPENTTLRIDRNQRLETTTISNDRSKSGSNPDKNAVGEEDLPTQLWSKAYENLRRDKKELITTYEKVLTKLASDGRSFALEQFKCLMLTKWNF